MDGLPLMKFPERKITFCRKIEVRNPTKEIRRFKRLIRKLNEQFRKLKELEFTGSIFFTVAGSGSLPHFIDVRCKDRESSVKLDKIMDELDRLTVKLTLARRFQMSFFINYEITIQLEWIDVELDNDEDSETQERQVIGT